MSKIARRRNNTTERTKSAKDNRPYHVRNFRLYVHPLRAGSSSGAAARHATEKLNDSNQRRLLAPYRWASTIIDITYISPTTTSHRMRPSDVRQRLTCPSFADHPDQSYRYLRDRERDLSIESCRRFDLSTRQWQGSPEAGWARHFRPTKTRAFSTCAYRKYRTE